MDVVIALVVEVGFAVIFGWSLITWIRRRDPISREVTLVFSALGSFFVLAIVKQVFGAIPEPITRVVVVLLLAQPVFTLRLVGLVRPLPRGALPVVYLAFAATAAPYLALGTATPQAVLLAAGVVFAVTEIVAALLLGATARARVGSARLRMALASVATLALAFTIVVASARSVSPAAADASAAISRVLAILATIAYLAAFLPPKPLRDLWQGMTAYRAIQDLLGSGESTAGPAEIWARFARIAREATSAGAVAVIATRDGSEVLLGSDRVGPDQAGAALRMAERIEPATLASGAEVDLASSWADVETQLASALGRFVRVMSLGSNQDDPRLYIWAPRRALFAVDDERLLSALGVQAAILADREAMKADQVQLSMQLGATVEALQRASQAKSDFLASMSHELRTPLNAILGFSELMRSEPQDASGQIAVPTEWIDHIQRGGQHLLALVNDVLDLAKIEAGRLELDPTQFDVVSAVSESVAGLRPLAERKSLAVEVDIDRDLSVVADRGRFRQVLYNLLSNAIKYTHPNGRITISGRREGDAIRLAVADTGIGIAGKDLDRVFDEFQQVGDREGHTDGTGLGLALTRRLLEAHGGRIQVESEPGRGSTFTISFPAVSSPATETEAPREKAIAERQPVGSGRRDVLIIEDDPGAARLLRAYLEPEGYGVRLAADGEVALGEARREPPAAILLDVLLPGIDGWDVLRRLKADPVLRDIPVVIVTVVDERDVGLALGAADYLVKPVSRTALLAALARYLAPSRASRRPMRILAVDDEPSALDVIDAVLRPAGFDLVRADGGREAIDKARSTEVDLVICDLVMPDLDGFDVVAALKADPATNRVPILIVTAHDLTEADKARLNGQVLGVVAKGAGASAGLRDWLATVLGGPNGGSAGSNGHAATTNGHLTPTPGHG